MYTTPAPTPGTGDLIGALLAGGAIYLGFVLLLALLGVLMAYAIIKTAVRQGMIEAIKKTGLNSGGSASFIQGYPPTQSYGAPVAPAAERSAYRNPNEF